MDGVALKSVTQILPFFNEKTNILKHPEKVEPLPGKIICHKVFCFLRLISLENETKEVEYRFQMNLARSCRSI